MLVEDRRGTARGARVWLAALAAVAVLAIAGAGSVSAVRGQSSLTGPGVTPREGTVATTIAFTVVYQNDKGSPAVRVWVTVGGTSQDMTAQPGGDWKKGTTFRWAGKLPVGSKTVLFQALGKDHSQASIAGGNVTITLVPKPTPTPTPTPKPTPTPTPKPRATPVPTPRPTLRPAPRTTPEPPSAPRPTPRIAPGTRSGPPAPVATPTTTPIPEGRTSEPSDGAFAEATSPPMGSPPVVVQVVVPASGLQVRTSVRSCPDPVRPARAVRMVGEPRQQPCQAAG